MRVRRLILPTLLLALAAPASASAANRYASPFSVDTSGNCDITACRLDRALEQSAGGTVTGLRIETSSAVALQLGGGAKGVGLELLADATNANAVAAKLL